MKTLHTLAIAFLLALFLAPIAASAASAQAKRERRVTNRPLTRTELKQAKERLAEMGYSSLTIFQKWEGREITGQLTRSEFDAIMNAEAPEPKDTGYAHVEVDVDRQVLLIVNEDGAITKILPVSTGSNRQYNEKGMRGLAYTPRGRFRIYSKIEGWRKSPLGLLYYPSYFSDGLAIHGNPSVPHSAQSHGCVRIPMSAAAEMSRLLPVGTIVLIYDSQSFVSARDWAEADRQKAEAIAR